MKKLLHIILPIVVLLCLANQGKAQSTLIHYWHFNNMAGAYHNPNIPRISPDYTVIDTSVTKAGVVYNDSGSSTYAGYLDEIGVVAGTPDFDSANLRMSAGAGNAYRFRNPSDSAYLTFFIPSTGYKNLLLKFAIESSNPTTAPNAQVYSYSTDSGATWKTTGLNMTADTIGQTFNLVSFTFGSDTTVNNNKKLVFRVRNTSRTTGGGNVRFDNISLDGDAIPVSSTPVLIHYWHFNNFSGAYHNPGIPSLGADYSLIDTAKARLVYALIPGAPANYSGYIDNFGTGTPDSDVYNLRTIGSTATPAGSCYRFRNPTDSAVLEFFIPSTGYKNLVFSYAVEASSVGHGVLYNNFAYSTDSGSSWKTNGLGGDTSAYTISADTTPQCIFKLVTVAFTNADTSVNNNRKLVFKITPSGNTHPIPVGGNDRFDNVTLDGVPVNSHVAVPQVTPTRGSCTLYPNPANTAIYINTPAEGSKIIMIYNTMGQRVFIDESKDKLVNINISGLSTGVYFANVRMQTGEVYTLRFVKN